MRVLVLIHEYPPIGGGGGKVAEDICEGLVERGHSIRLITTHLKGVPKQEERAGVEVIRIRTQRKFAYKASFLSMLLYIVNGFFHGLREIWFWKPDVMHVHFAVPAGVLGWALSVFTGVPYVLTAHLGDVPGGVPNKTDKWFKWIMPFTPPIWKRASKVIAVSDFTRGLALKHYPVPIDVIPNGIEVSQYPLENIMVNHPPKIVFAGRFVEQKNLPAIIRVLAAIKDSPWSCALLGDGPLRNVMQAEIKSHGLDDRIELPGWVTPAEVLDWFNKGDILFMPSFTEGLPVVGVQAMVKGLAIVASNTGGFVDLVEQGGNGYVFGPQDEEDYITALSGLLSDPEKLRQFRNKSREMVARFDLPGILDDYETVLQNAALRVQPV